MTFHESKGQCRFLHGNALRPDASLLARLIGLDKILHSGKNLIRYVHESTSDSKNCTRLYCEAYVFVWSVGDRIVLSDIDGTVTRSDITSVRDTILTDNYSNHHGDDNNDPKGGSSNSSKRSVAHRGICRLFTDLAASEIVLEQGSNDADSSSSSSRQGLRNIRFVYLTSRPFSLKRATRNFLNAVKQDGHGLPAGPILCRSTMSWAEVLIHELIHKNSDEFKADAVNRQIILPFAAAGNAQQQNLFVAGFGNRPTDGKAYEKVGVPLKDIYIINSKSMIIRYERNCKDSPNVCKEVVEQFTGGVCCSVEEQHVNRIDSFCSY
eukprot:CAMPEP_0196826970 /NCGR_PEP_ID=MMETSP1362-20130617/93912_1 /TAXON_ID=163516 /ORGANISM="Leptocylindrus danicus, Strain CCMP1856" /LENGTH=322 /DNA_ID=CAMNT_0042207579 /DNA_START=233 /DNA_END=1198 /DNA_ORIENTATION=+